MLYGCGYDTGYGYEKQDLIQNSTSSEVMRWAFTNDKKIIKYVCINNII